MILAAVIRFKGSSLKVVLLVLISSIWAQRTKWTLTGALIGGAQPMEGWWAPVARPHKREVRTSGTNDEVHRPPLFPTSEP